MTEPQEGDSYIDSNNGDNYMFSGGGWVQYPSCSILNSSRIGEAQEIKPEYTVIIGGNGKGSEIEMNGKKLNLSTEGETFFMGKKIYFQNGDDGLIDVTSEIQELKEKIVSLEEMVRELYYAPPSGPGYLKSKADFHEKL